MSPSSETFPLYAHTLPSPDNSQPPLDNAEQPLPRRSAHGPLRSLSSLFATRHKRTGVSKGQGSGGYLLAFQSPTSFSLSSSFPSLAHHCAETRTMPLLLPLFRSIFALASRAATTPRASLAALGTFRHAQHQLHTSTFTPRLTPRLPSSSSAAFSTSSRLPARPEHDSLFPGIPFRVEVNKGAKWEHESTIPAGVRKVGCSRRAAGLTAGGSGS